jgi:hypothetical protein
VSDSLPELADDDLETLIEALEAWEVKDLSGELMTSLMDSMLTDRRGPMPPEARMERERDKQKSQVEKRMRKERSVLLRAKLLTIRDRRRAETMVRDSLRPFGTAPTEPGP